MSELKIPRIVNKANYFICTDIREKQGPFSFGECMDKIKELGIPERYEPKKLNEEGLPVFQKHIEKVKGFYIVGDQEGKKDLAGPIFDRQEAAKVLAELKEQPKKKADKAKE